MSISKVKCSNGHYYDRNRYSECPVCQSSRSGTDLYSRMPSELQQSAAEAYVRRYRSKNPDQILGQNSDQRNDIELDEQAFVSQKHLRAFRIEDDDESHTVGVYQIHSAVHPVTGWLVCTKGEDLGRSFELKTGKNLVGRGREMDIRLSGDKDISINNHAVVYYEPKKREYFIQPVEMAYLNGQLLVHSEKLEAYDVLQIGSVKLMFVPFCGSRFSWDDYQE